MMLLLAVNTAVALDCAEVRHMLEIGLDEADVVDTIYACSLTEADLACIDDAGLPPPIISAAHASWSPDCKRAAAEPSTRPERPSQATPTPAWLPARYELPPNYFEAPWPGTAVGLSAGLGFGAGHFYARKPGLGAMLALGQAAGVSMIVAGLADDEPQGGLATAGWIITAGLRMFDVATAGASAADTRRAMLDYRRALDLVQRAEGDGASLGASPGRAQHDATVCAGRSDRQARTSTAQSLTGGLSGPPLLLSHARYGVRSTGCQWACCPAARINLTVLAWGGSFGAHPFSCGHDSGLGDIPVSNSFIVDGRRDASVTQRTNKLTSQS